MNYFINCIGQVIPIVHSICYFSAGSVKLYLGCFRKSLLLCFQNNTSIMNLDISMNGLGFEGSLQLQETLNENTCLQYLDISNNRINWEGISYVAKGIRKNSTLQMLKVVALCLIFSLTNKQKSR